MKKKKTTQIIQITSSILHDLFHLSILYKSPLNLLSLPNLSFYTNSFLKNPFLSVPFRYSAKLSKSNNDKILKMRSHPFPTSLLHRISIHPLAPRPLASRAGKEGRRRNPDRGPRSMDFEAAAVAAGAR